MKKLLIGFLVIGCISSFAKTEVVCQKFYQTEMGVHVKQSNINKRIVILENTGKVVSIIKLSTSSSISRVSGNESSILEKECVVIKY